MALGAAEAGAFPAIWYYLSLFYPPGGGKSGMFGETRGC